MALPLVAVIGPNDDRTAKVLSRYEQLAQQHGGRLVRSGAVSDFTAGLGSLEVEVEGDAGALVALLTERGFEARGEGRLALIALNGAEPYDAIRDCIVELDLGLVRLEQRRQSLEDLFRPGAAADGEEAEPASV